MHIQSRVAQEIMGWTPIEDVLEFVKNNEPVPDGIYFELDEDRLLLLIYKDDVPQDRAFWNPWNDFNQAMEVIHAYKKTVCVTVHTKLSSSAFILDAPNSTIVNPSASIAVMECITKDAGFNQ